jgi:hypothetical protein
MCAYRRYWKIAPPTHIIAAGFAGYKPPDDAFLPSSKPRANGLERGIEKLAMLMGVPLPPERKTDV